VGPLINSWYEEGLVEEGPGYVYVPTAEGETTYILPAV